MKKKILVIFAATTLITSMLAGCGNKETSNEVKDSEAIVEATEKVEAVQDTEVAEVVEPTETVETTETVEPTEAVDPLAGYTFTDMDKTMYATQTVNSRKGPSTDFDKVGSFGKNEAVRVLGQCNETGWYKVEVDRNTYEYVSNKYLSESKVETTASNTYTDSTTTPAGNTTSDNTTSESSAPAADTTTESSAPAVDTTAPGYISGYTSSGAPVYPNDTCPYPMYEITTYNGRTGYFADSSDSQADTDTASDLQFYLAEQGVQLPSTITWGHEDIAVYGPEYKLVQFVYINY